MIFLFSNFPSLFIQILSLLSTKLNQLLSLFLEKQTTLEFLFSSFWQRWKTMREVQSPQSQFQPRFLILHYRRLLHHFLSFHQVFLLRTLNLLHHHHRRLFSALVLPAKSFAVVASTSVFWLLISHQLSLPSSSLLIQFLELAASSNPCR